MRTGALGQRQRAGQLDIGSATGEGHLFDLIVERGGVGRGLRGQRFESVEGRAQHLVAEDVVVGRVGLQKHQVGHAVLLGQGQPHLDGHVTELDGELVHRPLEEVGVVLERGLRNLGQPELWQQAGPELLDRGRRRLDGDEREVLGRGASRVGAAAEVLPIGGNGGANAEQVVFDGSALDVLRGHARGQRHEAEAERQDDGERPAQLHEGFSFWGER